MNDLVIFLMSASPDGQASDSSMLSFLPIFFIIFIIYFFMIRPNAKRQKEHQSMLNNVAKGDKVITIGGIHGNVLEVKDNSLKLQIAKGIDISIEKSGIASIIKNKEEK